MNRTYKTPPLIEAVFEVVFTPQTNLSKKKLVELEGSIKKLLPIKDEKKNITIEVKVSLEGKPEKHKLEKPLYEYSSKDRKIQLKLGTDRFSIHHFAPYTSWENFSDYIANVLEACVKTGNIRSLRRLGVRYINKIKIPEAQVAIEDYFNLRPNIPNDKPLFSFFIGIMEAHNEEKDVLKIQLKDDEIPEEKTQAYIFDLDYYTSELDGFEITSGSLTGWAKNAHDCIENAFEEAITKKTKILFDKN